ncbi:hypothetical protein N7493_011136 [Penicillium malachiteum]|uniref:Uncharacterized protein n=1 Tax=Penicillium malachiteum TaxID=1324776 RepID=A0AAD6HBK5_9EURO|nr:hypothetical protein N7493_011136 [Penicillium malachiteum]
MTPLIRSIRQGHVDVFSLLLSHTDSNRLNGEDLLVAAVSNKCNGHEIAALLLQHRKLRIEVTWKVAMTAAENVNCQTISVLLDHDHKNHFLTMQITMSIIHSEVHRHRVFKLLLEQSRKNIRTKMCAIEFFKDVLSLGDWDLVSIFVQELGSDLSLALDENAYIYAFKNWKITVEDLLKILKFLLETVPDTVAIPAGIGPYLCTKPN